MRTCFLKPLLFVFILFVGFSCKKEKSNSDNPSTGEVVNTSIYGTLINSNNEPISGVTVTIAGSTKQTNENGVFAFRNIKTLKSKTVIIASKNDYWEEIRTIQIIENSDNQILIKLVPKSKSLSFSSSTGGSYNLQNGITFEFPTDCWVNKQSNTSYAGQVNLYCRKIDPSNQNQQNSIPGSLLAVDANSNEVFLESYGMFAIDVYDDNGNELQIAPNKKVKVEYPIPASLLSSAPNEIPTWSLNESSGLWEEEGTANRNGGAYIAELSHFSYWNFDLPGQSVNFQLSVQDQNNNPLSGIQILIKTTNGNFVASGTTNSNGVTQGLVLANSNLVMQVVAYQCGLQLHSQNFTTTTTAINLGIVSINLTNSTTLNMNIKDCSNANVSFPEVIVEMNNGKYFFVGDATGLISMTIPCNPNNNIVSFRMYDPINDKYGLLDTTFVSNGTNHYGSQIACGFDYQVFEIVYHDWTLLSSTGQFFWETPRQVITQTYTPSNTRIECSYNGRGTIDLNINATQGSIGVHNINYFSQGFVVDSFNQSQDTVTITRYDSIGGYIEGYFNLLGVPQSQNSRALIYGKFKVLRNQ